MDLASVPERYQDRENYDWVMHTRVPVTLAIAASDSGRDVFPGSIYYGRALDLRPEKRPDDSVSTGFWPAEGLSVNIEGMDQDYALETPLAVWHLRAPTVLPGDIVVLQCRDFIAAISLRQRKIGFITYGHGPVALPDEYVGPMLPPEAAKPDPSKAK